MIDVMSEPAAAALSYNYGLKLSKAQKQLIFDLGGGTFDVSIVAISLDDQGVSKDFNVIGSAGDLKCGGEDFDTALADFFGRQFYKNTNIKIKNIPAARAKLLKYCKEVKEKLSDRDQSEQEF